MPDDTDDTQWRLDTVIGCQDQILANLHAIQSRLGATLAVWDRKRKQAAGETCMLPELTRRLKALEARVAQLEGRQDLTP